MRLLGRTGNEETVIRAVRISDCIVAAEADPLLDSDICEVLMELEFFVAGGAC